jgi:hypothetical protein
MNIHLTVYPRQYTTRRPGEAGVVHSTGDASVQTLYELHESRSTNTSSWAFRKMVLDCALRLFGDFATWFEDQKRNPNLVGYNQEFLKDTLNFIHGGDRLMSVVVWTDLLGHTGTIGKVSRPMDLNPSRVDLGRGETTVQILQQWLSRPRGIDDLLQTLYLLFGQARRTAS